MNRSILIFTGILLLSSCGGDGNKSPDPTPTSTPVTIASPAVKRFNVGILKMDVENTGDNSSIEVDVSNVNSGTLSLSE